MNKLVNKLFLEINQPTFRSGLIINFEIQIHSVNWEIGSYFFFRNCFLYWLGVIPTYFLKLE
jgi:hypothetical protein